MEGADLIRLEASFNSSGARDVASAAERQV